MAEHKKNPPDGNRLTFKDAKSFTITNVMPEPVQAKSIDEMLDIVGGYGRFQKILNIMCCIIAFPSAYQLLIQYFSIQNPSWQCVPGSKRCMSNETFTHLDRAKCNQGWKYKTDWRYVKSDDFSIVTEFELHCDREIYATFAGSLIFAGWLLGSIVLGWITDNFGRNKILFVSIAVVLVSGFASAFVPNVWWFIVCRCLIGFFLPGTFPQVMFMYMSEMIGYKRRAFAGLSIFLFVGTALCFLCLQAYFIQHWRTLYIVCTAPYCFVLAFYFYMPESPRYLRIKGRCEEAMAVFRIIAKRNRTLIPDNCCISPPAVDNKETDNASPMDLFRTPSMAYRTVIQGIGYLVSAMAFFALYLGAADISGHPYQDFICVTVVEIPVSLMIMDFAERFGRKPTVTFSFLIGALMCIGLGFTPNRGKIKILRIFLAMIGKVSLSATCNSFQTWSVELYPTRMRGQGMGFVNIMSRVGAFTAEFVTKYFTELHEGSSQLFIGGCSLVAFFFLRFLPETKGASSEDDGEDELQYPTVGGNGHVELTDIGFDNPMVDVDE